MSAAAPSLIRNVALVGHHAAGKTTLAEALLHRAGAIDRRGQIADHNTVCDFEPEEHDRGFSLSLAVAPFEWQGHQVNLIDTPGYPDYAGEVHAAMRVADLLVFVVSAVDGVEVETERYWHEAAARGIPRMIFVNKLDRERASFERTLDQLRDRFGAGIAPLELPIGAEKGFHGVADLLTDRAYVYDGGRGVEAEVPDDMADLEHQVHDNLVEGIVVADDELLERYLEGEVPSTEELEQTLASGVADATVFPVVCGSAAEDIAVDRLADFICEVGPEPRRPTAGDRQRRRPVGRGGPRSRRANPWRSCSRPSPTRTWARSACSRCCRGRSARTTTSSTPAPVATSGCTASSSSGARSSCRSSAIPAGDIAAVAKLNGTNTGDTLAPKGTPVVVPPIAWPAPVLAVAVRARTQADEDKLATALHRLLEEDPSLVMERDDETHQTLLWGQGETHLQISLDKLERKFGVGVATDEPRVAYRETITGTGDAEGRYKKQTGGHGQFGVCSLRVEPLERGAGFEFVDQVVGGAIPRQFIPHVQKGVEETMARGGVNGYPVVDVRVTCYDGKYHAVDSSEMSFKTAARLAFRDAMAQADPVHPRTGDPAGGDRARPRCRATSWATSTAAGAGCTAPSWVSTASR